MVDDGMDDIVDLFLQEKPCRVLYAIENLEKSESYASNISSLVDSTDAYTIKILGRFEEMGITETEKKGRKKVITLSEEGSEVLDKLRPILDEKFGEALELELDIREKSRSKLQGEYNG